MFKCMNIKTDIDKDMDKATDMDTDTEKDILRFKMSDIRDQ